jgi:hypothetical protein
MTESRVRALLADLEHQRQAFIVAIEALGEDALETPIVGEWDARDLVVHVAFWSDHGADALDLVRTGRRDAFAYDKSQTDAMNAATAAAGRALALDAALARESAAYQRLHTALAGLIDAHLDLRLGNGDAVEDVVRYDGPDHYAEHAAHLSMPHRSPLPANS